MLTTPVLVVLYFNSLALSQPFIPLVLSQRNQIPFHVLEKQIKSSLPRNYANLRNCPHFTLLRKFTQIYENLRNYAYFT